MTDHHRRPVSRKVTLLKAKVEISEEWLKHYEFIGDEEKALEEEKRLIEARKNLEDYFGE